MKTPITIPCVGYEIAADLYVSNDAKDFLLIIVGLNSTKDRNSQLVEKILEGTHQNALVLDLSGHGASPFSLKGINPAQHLNEVVHAFDWLKTHYPTADITVMGTSYGGFLAAYLTQYRSFSKLLLRTPALYRPEDFFTNHEDIDIIQTAKVYRKDATEIIKNPIYTGIKLFTGPAYVVVHGSDEVVPIETTDQFIKSLNAETYIADGFKHSFNDPANPQDKFKDYTDALVNWLS